MRYVEEQRGGERVSALVRLAWLASLLLEGERGVLKFLFLVQQGGWLCRIGDWFGMVYERAISIDSLRPSSLHALGATVLAGVLVRVRVHVFTCMVCVCTCVHTLVCVCVCLSVCVPVHVYT